METIRGRVKYVMFPKHFFGNIEKAKFVLTKDDRTEVIASGAIMPIAKYCGVELAGNYTDETKTVFEFTGAERIVETSDDKMSVLAEAAGKRGAEALASWYGYDFERIFGYLRDKRADLLMKAPGVAEKTASAAIARYQTLTAIEEANHALKMYELNLAEVSRAALLWGSDAAQKIASNPYILSEGVTPFEKADDVAMRIAGLSATDDRRLACAVKTVLKRLGSSIYTDGAELIRCVSDLLAGPRGSVSEKDIRRILRDMRAQKLIAVDGRNVFAERCWEEKEAIREYLSANAGRESGISCSEADIAEYEAKKGFRLGDEQEKAVIVSSSRLVSIITGGPGTGKTTVLDCLLSMLEKRLKPEEICLCAPTGKAAVRMTQATGHQAKTIHRTLEAIPSSASNDEMVFTFNEENRLPFKAVVIDESSMIDYWVGSSLLKALKPDCQLIFVGDKDQLNPVGAGFFFRDLLRYGVATSELKKTYRQAEKSSIVSFSKMMKEGILSEESIRQRRAYFQAEGRAQDFAFVKLPKEGKTSFIADVYVKSVRKSSVEDSIVLTSQNMGECGVRAINAAILERMVAKGPEDDAHCGGWTFRIGARVIATQNIALYGIVNGQLGYVRGIDFDASTITVGFDDGQTVVYEAKYASTLALGYCITVHKSQGSEWKNVIEVVTEEHRNNSKPLLYTGLTRAKSTITVLGTAAEFVQVGRKSGRPVLSYI